MPIPFLFIGAAAVTGLYGAGKTVGAAINQMDAKSTNDSANSIVKEASNKINTCRKNTGAAIESLGKRKIEILNESISDFITEFEKLKHIELQDSAGINELQKIPLDKASFEDLKRIQSVATSLLGGVASGAVAGAITAFGAYSAAGAFATASTGAAISGLSGAAATNATLAFFGGGSLASGGLGMAGGTAVLGGLVAGPALAVLGTVLGAKASANRDKAYANYSKAKEFREEMNSASVLCIGIRRRASMFERFLISLNSVFEPLIYDMKQIIYQKGADYRTFTNEEKAVVAQATAMASAIKSILDTPILNEEGTLTDESEKMAELTRKRIEEFSR